MQRSGLIIKSQVSKLKRREIAKILVSNLIEDYCFDKAISLDLLERCIS
tara:strand:+ start:55306 stop:55452 length:147 start_codon:yes stop_codon:yes gene_type:complete